MEAKNPKLKTLIHVGADAENAKSLPALTSALLKILESSAGDEVKKAAIVALKAAFPTGDVTMNNCSLSA